MSDCLNNESMPNANGVVHTLQVYTNVFDFFDSINLVLLFLKQRHRDILRDYFHEYEKTKRNIISFKERENLLANSCFRSNESNLNNRRSDNINSTYSLSNSTSLYMKEYDHLKNSHVLIDQQLE